MDTKVLQNQSSTTERLFPEYLTEKNKTIIEQMDAYKKVADIFDRTNLALGRKIQYRTTISSTNNVKVNLNVTGATNKV